MKRNRKDNNHKCIVLALKAIGATVLDLSNNGEGTPDICVGYRGLTKLIEIKNKEYSYGKDGLSEKQQTFASKWRGDKIGVVTNIDEAIKFITDSKLDRE